MLQENELTYVIFNVSELPLINFTQVLQTSTETCRLSVDESQTLVKWEGSVPSSVSALTTKGPYLTHDEILEIMATPEWTQSMPME
jgi:hypothetical protein